MDQIEGAFRIPGRLRTGQLADRQPDGRQVRPKFMAEFIWFPIHVDCAFRPLYFWSTSNTPSPINPEVSLELNTFQSNLARNKKMQG